MKQYDAFEFPDELKKVERKAKSLEWVTLFYLLSTAVLVYLTMGSSQSMKTAYFEDLISMVPALSFLIAARLKGREPNKDFPFGYHRVVSIAYLTGALALFSTGLYLLIDSVIKLMKAEHVTIGMVNLFGSDVWLGYPMIAVMLWGIFPALILGKKKIPLAKKLHDKNLFTDAKMNKADWMTASGTIFGIIGIGLGWWWADGLAASLISVDILIDGFKNLKQSILDLMDETPRTVTGEKRDPLISRIEDFIRSQNWIQEGQIRLREEGHIYVGQGFVVPKTEEDLIHKLEDLTDQIQSLDWRIHEFSLTPVHNLNHLDEGRTS